MNIVVGHTFIKNTFGVVPKHAWQADTFGHSAATPELFSKMGFETVSFARIDEKEKADRKQNKTLEFIW